MTEETYQAQPPVERLIIKENGKAIVDAPLGLHHPLVLIPPIIRWLRKRARLTQQELADRLGIRRENISRWEHGSQRMSVSNTKRVLRFLKAVAPWKVAVTPEGPYVKFGDVELVPGLWLIETTNTEPENWPVVVMASAREDFWNRI